MIVGSLWVYYSQLTKTSHSHIDLNYNSVNKRIKELIKKVKLDGVKNIFEKYPHEISGGQMQRFMLVMALASSPKLLIADEPTTALDVTVQKEIIEILKSLQKTENLSILLISHNIGLVKNISNKIIVMKEGKLIENNHTQLILQSPKKKYTKGLLSININNKKRVKKLNTLQNFEKEIQNNNISKRTRNNRLKFNYFNQQKVLNYGPLKLDPEKFDIIWFKNRISLSALEYVLLSFLLQSHDQIVSKESILNEMKYWDKNKIYWRDKNINRIKILIMNLRTKLEPDPLKPKYIKTIYGKGYCLLLD